MVVVGGSIPLAPTSSAVGGYAPFIESLITDGWSARSVSKKPLKIKAFGRRLALCRPSVKLTIRSFAAGGDTGWRREGEAGLFARVFYILGIVARDALTIRGQVRGKGAKYRPR